MNTHEKTMQVGTILYTNWGYEQTNIDFYQVIKRTAHFVVVREIAALSTLDHLYIGAKMPAPDKFISPEIRRKIQNYGNGESIDIKSFVSAHIWDGKPKQFTSYA